MFGKYVTMKGNQFYYRRRIPADLQPVIGKTEIKRRIGLVDLRLAAYIADHFDTAINDIFQRARRKVVVADNNFFNLTMTVNESRTIADNSDEVGYAHWSYILRSRKPLPDAEDIANSGAPEHWQAKLLAELGLKSAKQTPVVTVSDAVALWLASKKLATQSIKSFSAKGQRIKWLLGSDTDIESVNRDKVLELRELYVLHKIPTMKAVTQHNITVDDVLQDKLPKDVKILSAETCKDDLTLIAAFLRYCHIRAKPQLLKNDLSINLALDRNDLKTPPKTVSIFTDEQIAAIYNIIKLERPKQNAKSNMKFEWRYWIFLVCLFSGARVGEICQLYVDDILLPEDYKDTDDISLPCFRLTAEATDSNKSVKNEYSSRIIPIHPWLIDHGFIDYVRMRRKTVKKSNLWGIEYDKSNGYRRSPERYYNKIIKSLGWAGVHFATTRHNTETIWANKLTQINDSFIARRIAGRSPGSGAGEDYVDKVLGTHYIAQPKPESMLPVIEVLQYDCLNKLT